MDRDYKRNGKRYMIDDQITNPEVIGVSLRDHDLLVELKTEMKGVRTDIKEIKDNSAERLNRLEDNKVDKKDFNDFKNHVERDYTTKESSRIPFLLAYGFSGLILTGFIGALVAFFIQSR